MVAHVDDSSELIYIIYQYGNVLYVKYVDVNTVIYRYFNFKGKKKVYSTVLVPERDLD